MIFVLTATAAAAATVGIAGYITNKFWSTEDKFSCICHDTDLNRHIIENCPTLNEKMEYSYWMNGHFQTIYCSLFRDKKENVYKREEWGDIVIDWVNKDKVHQDCVLIITGLFGSSQSIYISNLAHDLSKEFDVVILNFTSKISAPSVWFNQREIIHETIKHIKTLDVKYKHLFAIGFSNGGNSLINYITMDEKNKELDGVITISQGFDAVRSYSTLSGFYERIMASELREIMNKNQQTFKLDKPVNSSSIMKIEEQTTCSVTHYDNPENIYEEYSSYHNFDKINVPTLVLFSNDDPISNPNTFPYHSIKNKNIILAMSQYGGHIGWSEKYEDEIKINKICSEFINSIIEFKRSRKL